MMQSCKYDYKLVVLVQDLARLQYRQKYYCCSGRKLCLSPDPQVGGVYQVKIFQLSRDVKEGVHDLRCSSKWVLRFC